VVFLPRDLNLPGHHTEFTLLGVPGYLVELIWKKIKKQVEDEFCTVFALLRDSTQKWILEINFEEKEKNQW
jgi:hypothetical protein